MKKTLIIVFILVIIGAGAFYFFYLVPQQTQEVESTVATNVPKVNTTFDLKPTKELQNYSPHGEFPINIDPSSLGREEPFSVRSF